MARYRIYLGSDATPLIDGDDGVDTNAIRIEDPVGNVVARWTPGGAIVAQSTNLASLFGTLLGFQNPNTPVYSATISVDPHVASFVIINGVNGTAAAATINAANAGTAGQFLLIETNADASGTVTVTFGTRFRSSGTQATTASHTSTILFISDGSGNWIEVTRTTALA